MSTIPSDHSLNGTVGESVPSILTPQCPHCGEKFDAWHLAKIHVKHCKAGKPRIRKVNNMGRFGGSTDDASAPILSAGFWKKGTQVIGTVIRAFKTDNGTCYTIKLSTKPLKVDRQFTYPSAEGVQELEKVSVGSLKGFEMALQSSGVPRGELQYGDKVQITCTGKIPSGKGNDQVNFDVQIDRTEEKDTF